MRKLILATVAVAGLAFATAGSASACGFLSNCDSGDDVTNNYTTNNQGGQGGTGIGVGIGKGGSASATNRTRVGVGVRNSVSNRVGVRNNVDASSRNKNINKNANIQGQQQGQKQGQGQAQSLRNKNSAKQGQGQGQSMSFTDNSKVEAAAASAHAAALTASQGTCMGSASVGGQGMSFGFSVGSTWSDSDCNRRKYAAFLKSLEKDKAALALVCQNSDVAAAMEAAGETCPSGEKMATRTEETTATSRQASISTGTSFGGDLYAE